MPPLQLINGINLFIFIFVRLRETSGDRSQRYYSYFHFFCLRLSSFEVRPRQLKKKQHRDNELTDHREKGKEMAHRVTLNST